MNKKLSRHRNSALRIKGLLADRTAHHELLTRRYNNMLKTYRDAEIEADLKNQIEKLSAEIAKIRSRIKNRK